MSFVYTYVYPSSFVDCFSSLKVAVTLSSNQKLSIFVAIRVLDVQKFARMYIHTNISRMSLHTNSICT